MSNVIDLSQLPKPTCIAAVSFAAELQLLLDLYTLGMREQLADDTFPAPLVSDPAYQILSTVAYRLGLQRQSINEACYATMLAYAAGTDLDQIAATFNVARLSDETDSRLRARIQIALESWTTAGSRGSYEYHAMSADIAVLDVYLDRPEFTRMPSGNTITLQVTHDARLQNPIPGDVAVTVLIDPTAEKAAVLAKVTAALSTDDTVPLTDNPHLLLPEIIEYELKLVLWCYPGPSSEPILAAAKTDLETYAAANYKLGHDIALSGIHAAAHKSGVQRVECNLTQNIVVQPWQAAKCTSISITLGGRDV